MSDEPKKGETDRYVWHTLCKNGRNHTNTKPSEGDPERLVCFDCGALSKPRIRWRSTSEAIREQLQAEFPARMMVRRRSC